MPNLIKRKEFIKTKTEGQEDRFYETFPLIITSRANKLVKFIVKNNSKFKVL